MDAEFARFVRSRRDDATAVATADDHRFAAQAGIENLFD
jgi:hypothetical protein